MTRKTLLIPAVLVLMLLAATAAFAAPPDGPPGLPGRIYADGEIYATRGLTDLPAPNDNNLQSFDKIYVFPPNTAAAGQLSISETAPGDTDFNGGRWSVQTVTWKDGVTPTLLTSDADIFIQEMAGNLTVTAGSFEGGPSPYFLCPVVPLH